MQLFDHIDDTLQQATEREGRPDVHQAVLSVSSSNFRLADLEILERLGRLPVGVALTTDEAAVFLRLSRTTLERMRRLGTGPQYVQGGGVGARGTNQKCSYLKGDLIAWQQANRVSNSMAAAVRRGQSYMPFVDPTPKRSYFDLVTHRAFYVDKNGLVAGSMDDTLLETVLARLGRWRIVWLNPVAAVDLNWGDAAAFNEYGREIELSLSLALKSVTKALKA